MARQVGRPRATRFRESGSPATAQLSSPAPVLQTKLFVPPPRPDVIARPRLAEEINRALTRKLTLIAAPPGFGKTTLLSSWCQSPAESQVLLGWVSLDPGDNDPSRFWTYVLTALDQLQPGVAAGPLAALASAGQSPSPPIEGLLSAVLNGMSGLASDAVLVLDDYHVIESQPIHQGLNFLIEHLPACLHFMISTRADPPLPLARLRARGDLTEIRAADLRFTPDETATFLNETMGLQLDARSVAALEARTEGWIAGLQLAALALRDHADVPGFIGAFTGNNRYVLDYLGEEVISRQPPYLQTFLLRTSVLGRICAPLCDAVVGQDPTVLNKPACQSILEGLERANLFIVPLDDERRWYRYHQLFRDVLQGQLRLAESVETIAGLDRKSTRLNSSHIQKSRMPSSA